MSEISYKILLIGNSNVGKEIFFKKLSAGEYYEKSMFTVGIAKKTIDLDLDVINKEGKSIKKNFFIDLFDIKSQERYKSISPSYIKPTDGIFLIYDITNIYTFSSVKDWIDSINESLSLYYKKEKKCAIFLIGNKLDLVEKQIKERQVTEDEAKELCNKYDIIWGGEQSLKDLDYEEFIKLIGKYVGEIYKIVGENPPKPKEQKIKHKKNIEKIEKVAKEKESRIKKNSCPSDSSDE